jgi:hypothetical protein
MQVVAAKTGVALAKGLANMNISTITLWFFAFIKKVFREN